MNDFDKAGRYLAKRDSAGFLRWLLGNPAVQFHSWIDTRRLALSNQGDLTSDLVAALRVPGGFEALCVEVQAEARAETLPRSLSYVSRLVIEPADEHSLPLTAVGGAILNLTGRNLTPTLSIHCAAAHPCRLDLTVVLRNLCDESAADLLAGVESGEISPWQLGWAPLMQGGADLAIIGKWCELAERGLAEERDRADLGAVLLVFATLAGQRGPWQRRLRRWNVKTSPFLDEIRAEGRQEGKQEGRELGRVDGVRDALLRLGRQKFKKPPTRKQQQQLEAIADLNHVQSLIDQVLNVDSWAQLLNGH